MRDSEHAESPWGKRVRCYVRASNLKQYPPCALLSQIPALLMQFRTTSISMEVVFPSSRLQSHFRFISARSRFSSFAMSKLKLAWTSNFYRIRADIKYQFPKPFNTANIDWWNLTKLRNCKAAMSHSMSTFIDLESRIPHSAPANAVPRRKAY